MAGPPAREEPPASAGAELDASGSTPRRSAAEPGEAPLERAQRALVQGEGELDQAKLEWNEAWRNLNVTQDYYTNALWQGADTTTLERLLHEAKDRYEKAKERYEKAEKRYEKAKERYEMAREDAQQRSTGGRVTLCAWV